MHSKIHLQWDMQSPRKSFRTGVSLHSHTLHSRESLNFIHHAAKRSPLLAATLHQGARRYRKVKGAELDLGRGWWTPPLAPHGAWKLESSQIEGFGLNALVSLTDHDDIEAPVSLNVLPECSDVPVSVEWTVPWARTFFHIGIHNLPRSTARNVFREMSEVTVHPSEQRIRNVFHSLAATPETLIVFNHPLWDEKGIGQAEHRDALREFLALVGTSVHAMEVNGLRPWRENQQVIALARDQGLPVISGGDRHGLEPNANLNLTNAATFDEFVEEVRHGWSDVLILNHYREAHASRIIHNMLDILRTHEEHANGWRLWSDRVFYLCDDGATRSLTEVFGAGTPPSVAIFVGLMQFASAPPIRRFLRDAFAEGEKVVL